jgi:hypothetical protein
LAPGASALSASLANWSGILNRASGHASAGTPAGRTLSTPPLGQGQRAVSSSSSVGSLRAAPSSLAPGASALSASPASDADTVVGADNEDRDLQERDTDYIQEVDEGDTTNSTRMYKSTCKNTRLQA